MYIKLQHYKTESVLDHFKLCNVKVRFLFVGYWVRFGFLLGEYTEYDDDISHSDDYKPVTKQRK